MRQLWSLLHCHKGLFLLFALLLTSSLAVGCSSGGGGDGTPGTGTGNTITGTVSAPGATLVKAQPKGLLQWFASLFVSEGIAQTTGLQPIPNTNILLFEIDNLGNPTTGTVLASTTTDANGDYSLALPSETGFASNLIVQASPVTTPTPVTDPNTNYLNCPAVGPVLNIDPAAQLATQAIISNLAAAGGTLTDNYTTGEIAAFINLVQTFAEDPNLIGTTIEETISNISTALSDLISIALDGIENPGETAAPQTLGGTYAFVGFFAGMDFTGFFRETNSGTVTLNATDKTFTVNLTGNGVNLNETCPTGGTTCDRTFTRTSETFTETFSGTYQLSGNGQIFFTFSAIPATVDEPAEPAETILGFINPAGTLVVLPFSGQEDVGLVIAIQQGSGLSNSTVAGTFNSTEHFSIFPASSSPSGSWNSYTSEIGTGSVTFSGSNYNFAGSFSGMSQTITCTPTGSGCSQLAVLNATPGTDVDSGTFTVSSTGGLTLTSIDGESFSAQASADGNFGVVSFSDLANGEVGITLLTRQGSDMSNATLNGTYNFAGFEDNFTTSGDIEIGLITGSAIFDGTGGWTILGAISGSQRQECQGQSCPFVSIDPITDNFSVNGTYSVNPDGTFTFSANDPPDNVFTFDGTIGSDGSVIVLREIRDGGNDSQRFLSIGVKQ